jgi:bacillithiol system protein YtxJ
MGIFSSKRNDFNWLLIKDMVNYKDAVENSYNNAVLIFKHSTRCSISSMALNRIESAKVQDIVIENCYLLDLLSFRNISNQIAVDFDITHASPQILVIKNGKCIFNTSHNNISWNNIEI